MRGTDEGLLHEVRQGFVRQDSAVQTQEQEQEEQWVFPQPAVPERGSEDELAQKL